MKAWLKYGLIVVGIFLFILMANIVFDKINGTASEWNLLFFFIIASPILTLISPIVNVIFNTFPNIDYPLITIIDIIFIFIVLFIIGAIIGLIVSAIKGGNRK